MDAARDVDPGVCSRNNVPYKVLDRWIRDIYKKVVPVQIIGTPEELKIENPRHTVDCRLRAEQMYDKNKSFKKYIDLYDSLLK